MTPTDCTLYIQELSGHHYPGEDSAQGHTTPVLAYKVLGAPKRFCNIHDDKPISKQDNILENKKA